MPRKFKLKPGHVECGWCAWTGPEHAAHWAWEWWMCHACWMEMHEKGGG